MSAAPTLADAPTRGWDDQLARYRQLRAASDAMPLGSEGEDGAVDAYCEAMDVLLVTPAPDVEAVALKAGLIRERDLAGIPDDWLDTLVADARGLAEAERRAQLQGGMPVGTTSRGFPIARGADRYGAPWSVQDSSLAGENALWLGGEKDGRAHLTQAMVAELLPLLHRFVAVGTIAEGAA